MLGEGVRRAAEKSETAIHWICGDAEKLPVPDAHFDAYTIAFGIRNVTHIDAALREARRVLKPGGRFLCLEFSNVEVPGLDTLYDAYSFKLLPKIGGLVAGDEDSYRYLAESIRRFPPQAEFARMIARCRPGPGQSPQSLRRHRRHAFGLARYDGQLMRGFPVFPASGMPRARYGSASAVRQGRLPPARLAQVLEQPGPAYIKLGQMLATRPDIVGEDVATRAGTSAGPPAAFSRRRGPRR